VNSSNVPICPVMPFATERASREYVSGLFAWARVARQHLWFVLGDWATQCRASHCIERPAHDRGQALGVRFFGPFAANYHFCYLPGCALLRSENTSNVFLQLENSEEF
jgi:hypothetical protein